MYTQFGFKAIESHWGCAQTEATFTTRIDLGGNIPRLVMNYCPTFSIASDFERSLTRIKRLMPQRLQIIEKMKNIGEGSNNLMKDEGYQWKRKGEYAFQMSDTW